MNAWGDEERQHLKVTYLRFGNVFVRHAHAPGGNADKTGLGHP